MEPTTRTPLWKRATLLLLLAFAALQFLRSYFFVNAPYLNEAQYEAGTERMPFQARILMAWIDRALDHTPAWDRAAAHLRGPLHDPATLAIAAVGLVSLALTALVLTLWYRATSLTRRLPALPFALFLWMIYATYLARFQEAIYFPYDLLNVALFTLALYLCFRERYLALAILFPIACLNRETILVILLPLALNAWQHLHPDAPTAFLPNSRTGLPSTAQSVPSRSSLAPLAAHPDPLLSPTQTSEPTPQSKRTRTFPLREAILIPILAAIWIAIHLHYTHRFAHNPTELGLRIHANLAFLKNPQTWSQILSGAGFLLPVPFLWFHLMPNRRLRLYSLLIPVWILAMFLYGNLPESRVFGELIGFLALYCTLQFETATTTPQVLPDGRPARAAVTS